MYNLKKGIFLVKNAIIPSVTLFQTIHIWDIYEECLLQTLKIKFPFLGILGHKVEFGAYCIHPGVYFTIANIDYESLPNLTLLAEWDVPSIPRLLIRKTWDRTQSVRQ